jgi:hypothetical protein
MHMYLVVGKKLSMHKIVQSHPELNLGLFFCTSNRCVEQIVISWSWIKSTFFMTT